MRALAVARRPHRTLHLRHRWSPVKSAQPSSPEGEAAKNVPEIAVRLAKGRAVLSSGVS
jgi:hypothetical protein